MNVLSSIASEAAIEDSSKIVVKSKKMIVLTLTVCGLNDRSYDVFEDRNRMPTRGQQGMKIPCTKNHECEEIWTDSITFKTA